MNITATEQHLSKFLSSELGLQSDNALFRGRLPLQKINALAVAVDDVECSGCAETVNFNISLFGRYRSRDDALNIATKLVKLLPVYRSDFSLLPASPMQFEESSFDGQDATILKLSVNAKL